MTVPSAYHRWLAVLGLFTCAAGDVWRYSLTWFGWGAIAGVAVTLAGIELVRARVRFDTLPLPLIGFVALTFVSAAWSFYPVATVLGSISTLATVVFGVFVATFFDWSGILRVLGLALRFVLGASLLFELIVAVFVRRPVLPFWVDYSDLDRIPNAFYWSRDLLFEGGRIQGIQGNANLLAMSALIALIVFVLQLAAREISVRGGVFWIAVAGIALALTRSSTIVVCGAVVVIVAVFLLLLRRSHGRARITTWVVGVGVLAGGAASAVLGRDQLFGLLGRSSDLTNRLDIWQAVTALAVQRPAGGWGWISYWAPWVPPYDDLVVIKGVHYYQAHEAWLDMFLQLGIVGLVVFGALVLGTLTRSWTIALSPDSVAGPRWPVTLAAPLLLTVLLVQSLAESRMLIELGLALLVTIAVSTRRAVRAEPRPDRVGVTA